MMFDGESKAEKNSAVSEGKFLGEFDVCILGGGINGVGIARDLSMRGVKVILFEKEDFGWATTWSSSSLIHGGARYIIHDIGVTYKSSREAGILTKICPYLLSRRPFLIPVNSGLMKNLFDIYMGVYDVFSRMRGAMRRLSLSPEEVERFTGGEVKAKSGGILIEEYATDPPRLALVNAISAKENGAEIMNHAEVVSLKGEEGNFEVSAKTIGGNMVKAKAKLILNTTGPWIDKVISNLGVKLRKKGEAGKRKLRPTKGIHIVFPGKVLNTIVSFQAIDGRYLLFVPLEDRTIFGTTDDDFFGDPDDIEILRDEVEYLMHSGERFIPRIRELKPYSTKVGLRPTPYVYGVNEDKITREFEIDDDFGFISVMGGKLASFRLLSEIVSDFVVKKLGINAKKCMTHHVPLPGADDVNPDESMGDFENYTKFWVSKLVEKFSLSRNTAYFLVKKYGSRSEELISEFGLGDVVCGCGDSKVFEGEIRWAVAREMAKTIDDVARRTWACDGPCNGIFCMKKVSRIIKESGGIPREEEFLRRREKLLYPVRRYNPELWDEFQKFKDKFSGEE